MDSGVFVPLIAGHFPDSGTNGNFVLRGERSDRQTVVNCRLLSFLDVRGETSWGYVPFWEVKR